MIYSGRYDGYVRYLMYPMVFAVGFIPYVLRESQNELRSCTIVIVAAELITALFFGCFGVEFASLAFVRRGEMRWVEGQGDKKVGHVEPIEEEKDGQE